MLIGAGGIALAGALLANQLMRSPVEERSMKRSEQRLPLRESDPMHSVATAETLPRFEDEWRQIGRMPLPTEREVGFIAALRAWCGSDPAAAAQWAMAQTELEPIRAMKAVFAGLTADPERAIALANRIRSEAPATVEVVGRGLIAALVAAEKWESAMAFAAAGDELANEWTSGTLGQWAMRDPHAAALAALRLGDPGARRAGFAAVAGVWAGADAPGLAELAVSLPSGSERTIAFEAAMRSWIQRDAVAAAGWLARVGADGENDGVLQAIAEAGNVAVNAGAATGWAELIRDPERRSRMLRQIVMEWAGVDFSAARRYAESSPGLLGTDRAEVIAFLSKQSRR